MDEFKYAGCRKKFDNLSELLNYRAEHQADQAAYTFLSNGERISGRLTFSELRGRAYSVAGLIETVNRQKMPVVLLFPSGLDFIVTFFGCLVAGAIAVPAPIPGRRDANRLLAILDDSQAKIVITTRSAFARLDSDLIKQFEERFVSVHCIDDAAQSICVARPSCICLSSIAFLQYTSGSTHTPKGVVVTHANLLHNLSAIADATGRRSSDVSVSWLPLFHDMGLIDGVLSPIYSGYHAVLMSPEAFVQKPIRWLMAISRFKATISGAPNFAYAKCVEKVNDKELNGLDLGSWRVAYNGAEPVKHETIDAFCHRFSPYGFRSSSLLTCYGLAESTLCVSVSKGDGKDVLDIDSELLKHNKVVLSKGQHKGQDVTCLVSSGSVIGDQSVVIADPVTNTCVNDDMVGEIWVKGASVTQGYWQRPLETDAAYNRILSDINEGPFLATGDLGFIHNHRLYVVGRVKDLIIIHGKNHYPQDIETTCANAHPALRPGHAAAFSVEHDSDEKVVVVQELVRNIKGVDLNEVIDVMRESIALCHQLPVYALVLVKIGGVPMTSSGKIQRSLCKNRFLNDQLSVVKQWGACANNLSSKELSQELFGDLGSPSPDRTQAERSISDWLCSQISQQLGVRLNELEKAKSLSGYGLDSAGAMELCGAINDKMGIEVSPIEIFDHPSVDALSQHIAGQYLGAVNGNHGDKFVSEVDRIFVEIEDMSDEEVAHELARER